MSSPPPTSFSVPLVPGHFAAKACTRLSALRVLLAEGADPDRFSDHGTPLRAAVGEGNGEAARHLLTQVCRVSNYDRIVMDP